MLYRLFLSLLLVLLGLRIFSYFSNVPNFPEGTHIRINNRVTSEPLIFENSQYFKLYGLKIYLPKYPQISYGDEIIVEGIISKDKLTDAKLVKIATSDNVLIRLREKLLSFYKKNLPIDHSALVAGVVLGSKQNIRPEFWERLKITGTVHVVVASGMNVSIVAKFLISALVIFLPRRKAIPLALLGIWTYSIMSGFDAPIIRASIMGSITFVAQELGKLYYAGRALIFSAIIMIFFKPEWLIDLGFLLSFVATTSILLLNDSIYNFFKKVPDILRSDLSSSLSAQIGVAPILFASFGQFNILSPLYNLAVLWTIPIITLIGMISAIVSLMYVPAAQILLFLVYPFTSWFITITTFLQ